MGLVYAILSLFRLYNDAILSKTSGTTGDVPLRPAIWNSYLEFLKSQSPLARLLVTWLNVLRIVEVPFEMVIGMLLGVTARHRFILLIELQKMLSKTALWMLSGFRKTTGSLMPSMIRAVDRQKIRDLDLMSDPEVLSKSIEKDHPEYLEQFIKSSRSDALLLFPELTMSTAMTLAARMRELAHILRPLVYAGAYLYGKRDSRTKWAAWSISLALELFACWPQVFEALHKRPDSSLSPIEQDENSSRLIRLLLFLLREPLYSSATKERLNGLKAALGEWRILKPLVDTASSYQKLCEQVFLYTLSS